MRREKHLRINVLIPSFSSVHDQQDLLSIANISDIKVRTVTYCVTLFIHFKYLKHFFPEAHCSFP